MDITPFFELMVQRNASDLYFIVGVPPHVKVNGITESIGQKPLNPQQISEIFSSIMTDKQRKEFESTLELNMALTLEGIGRFRVNAFRQRGEIAMVARYVKENIATLEFLNLPEILKTLIMELRGLILVVGSPGAGKTTTVASMIDYRNVNSSDHIITIEDPIEFLYKHKKSVIVQREVGVDTLSFDNALKNAMREGADIISIGEIRDTVTMKHALSYAQTGHLCISTLHANNSNQALERIINFFPKQYKQQLLLELSLCLKAIVSLRLITAIENQRLPAVEVLINSPYIAELIKKGNFFEIKEVMGRSRTQGMQTFDQALFDLFKDKKISREIAIQCADSKNDVALQIRLTEENLAPDLSQLSIKHEDMDKL